MTNYRGFAIGSTAIPVSSVNATITRNAIVESTMGSVGAPAIYGGVYSASGTLEAPYRTDVEPLIISLFGGPIANGVVDTSASSILTNVTLADQYVGITFASSTVTSMDLTMQVKDYCKTSFNYIGVKGAAGAVTTQPSYTNPVAIFYNALLTVASATVSAMGVTIHVERPIDTDYFVLGTEFLQGFNQSGPAVISGSITLAPPEATLITTAINLASADTVSPSNTNANPVVKAWITDQPVENTDDAPDYSLFDGIVPGKRESWGFFLRSNRDFSRNKVRKWVTDVWGNATSGSNAELVLQAATKSITFFELMFGGTDATTGTVTAKKLNILGPVAMQDVSAALNLP